MTLITTFYQNDLKFSFLLCKMKLIYGWSSLLFIFPTFKAFLYSQSIFWKLSNLFLIPISFLCNAMEYKNPYLLLDYLCIFLVSISYIQHLYWNHLFLYFLFIEYFVYDAISRTKDIVFTTAGLKSLQKTFYYYPHSFPLLLTSSILTIIFYKIRNYWVGNKLLFTFLFHVCIMNILYVSCLTI